MQRDNRPAEARLPLNRITLRNLSLICAGVLVVVCLVAVQRQSDMRSELVDIHSKLVKQIYLKDVARGEKIIRRMANKVPNPVWKALVEDKHMRKVLAAALGAQKAVAGGAGAGGLNLASMFQGGSAVKAASVHTKNLATTSRHGVRNSRAQHEVSNADWVATIPQHNTIVPAAHQSRQQLNQPPALVYNAFAPGVLSGDESAAPPPEVTAVSLPSSITAPPASNNQVLSKSVVDGLNKATGFDDNYARQGTENAASQSNVPSVHSDKRAGKQTVIGIVEQVIHNEHGITTPDSSDARESRGSAGIEGEVMKTLQSAQKLRAIGHEIRSGHSQVEDDSSDSTDGRSERESAREKVLQEKKAAYVRREQEQKAREKAEAKAMLDSMQADNDLVFGNTASVARDEERHREDVQRASDSDDESQREDTSDEQPQRGDETREVARESDEDSARHVHRHDDAAVRGREVDKCANGDCDENRVREADRNAAEDRQQRPKTSRASDSVTAVRFKDDLVKADDAESESPYQEKIDDGRGPGEMERVKALGFTDSQQCPEWAREQYERHKMESALQKERREVAALRRQEQDERGGLRSDLDRDIDQAKGLFSDGSLRLGTRRRGSRQEHERGGSDFAAGAEAERQRELVERVRKDLRKVERYISPETHDVRYDRHVDMRGDRGRQDRFERDSRARRGVRGVRGGDEGSVLPKSVREGLQEDVRQMGDRLVPVKGQSVNLDII